MRKTSFHALTRVVRIMLVSSMIWGATAAVCGQEDTAERVHKYSLASIRGDYAVVNHYGANLALALGTERFDGSGGLHGSAILNRPTANGARELVPLSFIGTYTVNDDGTGVILLAVTLPDGTIRTATEDFVITRAEMIGGIPVATKILDAQREASLVLGNGVFVTQEITRRVERRNEEDGSR